MGEQHEISIKAMADLRANHQELRSVDFVLADLNGVLRAKRAPVASLERVVRDGLRFPGSVFSMDSTGSIVDGTGIVSSEGERDRICRVVPETLAPVPWARSANAKGSARAQALLTMLDTDGRPFFADPRAALARVLDRFSELDRTPVVAVELELYLIDPAAPDAPPAGCPGGGMPQVYADERVLWQSDFVERLAEVCAAQQIPTDTAVAESHAGHFEINLQHVDDALRAADHAVLFKRAVHAVARERGMLATFMAMPFSDSASSGLHVHVSLRDGAGRNVFAGSDGKPGDELRRAVGGLCATMPEAMAVLAPNANSYRRYRPGSFVPRSATWGVNNRTVALRVPPSGSQALRVEHRVAGADANVYLVLAAVLAGVHHGLTGRIDAPAPVEGNAHRPGAPPAPPLPLTWPEALAHHESASVLPGYLGERLWQLYGRVKRAEHQRFASHVSPLERRWYLTAF